MGARDRGPEPRPSDALDAGLYPDLIRLGGLAQAMSRLARAEGTDLGEIHAEPGRRGTGRFTNARVDTDRGAMEVRLGLDDRWFFISISSDAHLWTAGGTDDLGQVVGVADAWRKGALLGELHDRFSFMRHSALAQAYEDGDPVATQWDLLLAHETYEDERPLLLAAHADERLRQLFPLISHGSLVLSRDARDRTAEEFWIVPLPGGGYQVRSTKLTDSAREMASAEEALELTVAYLLQ